MGFLLELAASDRAIGLIVWATLLLLVLWLCWRKPTFVLLVALAALAVRPELFWGGPALHYAWSVNHTLVLFGLIMNGLRYGVRVRGGWPIPAMVATFVLGFLFGRLHPQLTLPFMLMGLAVLALPFACTQVALAPGSRRAYALVIMLTPLVSFAIGLLMEPAQIDELLQLSPWAALDLRIEGATGNAAVFATLAFAGLVAAVHEATRPGRPYAELLAAINLALVILSGTRMAMFASVVFLVAYTVLSPELRETLRQHRVRVAVGAVLVGATFAAYWPTLEARMFRGEADTFQLSGRDELWSFYWQEFLFSPLFGRGFGAGFIAAESWLDPTLPTPHNEYLHLLVVGGVVGFVLCAAAIGFWYRALWRSVAPEERLFLAALGPAIAAYAVTDNLLVYATALSLFAYLGVVRGRPEVASVADLDLEPDRPAGYHQQRAADPATRL